MAGALAVVAGCLLPSEPVEQLDLSLSLSTTRVHADTGVLVRVTAVNHRARTVELETTGGCVVGYHITGPDGAEVRPNPRHGCHSILERVTIGPGDSVFLGFRLLPTPRFDPGRNGLIRWAAGTYRIAGLLLDRDTRPVRETRPVEFQLICSDPAWAEC